MTGQRSDKSFPELQGLQIAPSANGITYYPQKAIESHRRLWEAAYALRSRQTVYMMEFTLRTALAVPVYAEFNRIFPYHKGEALAAHVVARIAPTGQPLIVDCFTGGASIFGIKPTIAETQTEAVKVTEFVRAPLEANEGEVFTAAVIQRGSVTWGDQITLVIVWKLIAARGEE